MVFSNFGNLNPGDALSVWLSATQNTTTFDVQSAAFFLFRISELLKTGI